MVYLLNILIFHGYVSHNQRVPCWMFSISLVHECFVKWMIPQSGKTNPESYEKGPAQVKDVIS